MAVLCSMRYKGLISHKDSEAGRKRDSPKYYQSANFLTAYSAYIVHLYHDGLDNILLYKILTNIPGPAYLVLAGRYFLHITLHHVELIRRLSLSSWFNRWHEVEGIYFFDFLC